MSYFYAGEERVLKRFDKLKISFLDLIKESSHKFAHYCEKVPGEGQRLNGSWGGDRAYRTNLLHFFLPERVTLFGAKRIFIDFDDPILVA
jgi:hypothetical protein